MESKFDWLTLTIKPESEDITFWDTYRMLEDKMLLKDLFKKMVHVGRIAHYEECVGYENITLCMPSPKRFREQGFCLRMSSQGLDFLERYLNTYNITSKQWLGMFRALCFQGFCTSDTRLDYAMDDIHYNGEKPYITMDKIILSAKNGDMCKRGHIVDIYDGSGEVLMKTRLKKVNKEPVAGRTLTVGSRHSETFCRFYDKLAEQRQKKQPIPENCTSWTRCELELKGSAAMGALNAYLDRDSVDFGKYMRGVVNGYVSFIVRNNSNISRCPLKRWWAKFLGGCTEKFKLPHKRPARFAWARARCGLIQYLSIIYTLWQELGAVGLYKFFKQELEKKRALNPLAELYKPELADNIRDGKLDYEKMTAFKRYQYNSYDSEKGYEIAKTIDRQWSEYTRLSYNAHHLGGYDLDKHIAFMNGQEVLG